MMFRTNRGVINLLVIVDRFTKLVRSILLNATTAVEIYKAFTSHWAFSYVIPKSLITVNGKQFNPEFL